MKLQTALVVYERELIKAIGQGELSAAIDCAGAEEGIALYDHLLARFFSFALHRMRVVLLCATCLWLTNSMLLGSIGGTMLELFIGLVNASTILRLWREQAPGGS